ncbi:hypothetical protein OAK87_00565 [bacterium]|nr:hypothetical protein [bacterium]
MSEGHKVELKDVKRWWEEARALVVEIEKMEEEVNEMEEQGLLTH